jgi:hypothetical protein
MILLSLQDPIDARLKPEGPPASDHNFLRRATLDTLGRLPTPDEIRAFEKTPDRARKIDELLGSPEAADYFADLWLRILMNYRFEETVPLKMNVPAFRGYLRDVYAKDVPYRDFVTQLLSDQGDNQKKPATNYVLVSLDPKEPPSHAAGKTMRVFLGVQMQCAQCHDHPFYKYTQEDFWGIAAFFGGAQAKARTTFDGFGVKLMSGPAPSMKIPDTTSEVKPRFLDGRAPEKDEPALQALARFVVESPNFNRAIVNRVWAQLMGKGFIEPVDNLEAHPPRHPELFDALAADFAKHQSLRRLVRSILSSRAYQSAGAELKPQNPVQLLNTLSYALELNVFLEKFYEAYAKNFGDDNFFAKSYGNRDVFRLYLHLYMQSLLAPSGTPPEEAKYTGSVRLALKLMNSGDLQGLVKAEWGKLAAILKAERTSEGRLTGIFYALLSRPPTAAERERYLAYVGKKKENNKAFEDVYWTLLNSTEFIFNH